LWLVALVALIAIVAISPIVQTWIAGLVLSKQATLHGSIGDLSARFGKVEIEDLRLEKDGAVLTIPSLKAWLPVTHAVWNKQVRIEHLISKGWTLDLTRKVDAANTPAQVVTVSAGEKKPVSSAPATFSPSEQCLRFIHDLLNDRKLPYEVSLDQFELEGDILTSAAPGSSPAKLHVTLSGGGLSAGKESTLSIDTKGRLILSSLQLPYLSTHGTLTLALDSAQILRRAEIKTSLVISNDSLRRDLDWSLDASVTRMPGGEAYSVALSQAKRPLVSLIAQVPSTSGRPQGTWKLQIEDSDLAPIAEPGSVPSFAISGEGSFDADAAFSRVHALGQLKGPASGLSVLSPSLRPLGSVNFDVRFDAVHSGHVLRFNQFGLSLSAAKPIAAIQSLQPFDCDERSGRLSTTEQGRDWLEASIAGLPLAWLAKYTGDFEISGNDATGKFAIRSANGAFALSPITPFTAGDVTVRRAGKVIGQGLELSLSLLVDYSPAQWQVQWAPFTLGSAGQIFLSSEGKAQVPAKTEQPGTVTGTWKSDLKALSAQASIPGASWLSAGSASGDFSATLGDETTVEGKMAMIGPEADQSITLSYQATVGLTRAISFHAPIKIALGSNVSEITADGTWYKGYSGNQISTVLTGKDCSTDHLRLLAAPLAALGGAPRGRHASTGEGAAQVPADKRDTLPFWGDWVGHVNFAFERFKAWNQEMNGLRATLGIEYGAIRMDQGSWKLTDRTLAMWTGELSFDPAADLPYKLKATAVLGEIEVSPFFGKPPAGKDPVFNGRFSVVKDLKGSGVNFDDFSSHIEEEFKLTSKNGIIRLLKTNVAEAIPEPSTPGADALSSVGETMGAIFGAKKGTVWQRQNRLSKNTEGVLNFTYEIAEFRYDELSITATRGADRVLRLSEITMLAPDVHMVGTGQIAPGPDGAFNTGPLSVDLQVGFRGAFVKFLTAANLLSPQKDDKGYTLFREPVHFGGTMQKIDASNWHDILLKAAMAKPEEVKKDSAAASAKTPKK
jgi:hypothetical protein